MSNTDNILETSDSPRIMYKDEKEQDTSDKHMSDDPDCAEERDVKMRGFELGEIVGTGTFAVVKEVSYKGSDKVLVVKIVKFKRYDLFFSPIFHIREKDVVSKLRHPYITKFYKIFWYPDMMFLFMEKLTGGSMRDYMKKNRGPISESRAQRFFLQLLDAMNYLHDLKVAHRDLKLENVLLDNEENCRLADFGFSIALDISDKPYLSETFCGSHEYLAPEVLENIPYDVFQSDVWSLGVLIFAFVTGRLPFRHKSVTQIVKAQYERNFDYPKDLKLSSEFLDLNKRMMEPHTDRRWSMERLLKHEWTLKKYFSAENRDSDTD